MITDLNEILVEWAYRTNDGKPDVKNNAKLLTLEGVLKDFGWSREARAELLNTLMEIDIVRKKQPDGSMGSSYTVKKHNPEKGQVLVKKNASNVDIVKVTKKKVDKEKGDEKPQSKEITPEKRQELTQQDIELVETQLFLYEGDEQEKGGLGTPESRTGECVTTYAGRKIKQLMADGKTYEEAREIIRKELIEHTNTKKDGKKPLLTKEWVESGLRCLDWIDDNIGIDKIEDFAWDTPEGNELVGSTGHGTSADMFVKTNDGETIGISLKKDFKVFVFNGGMDKNVKKLAEEMGMSPDDLPPQLQYKGNPKAYKERRDRIFEERVGKFNDSKVKKKVCESFEKAKKGGDDYKAVFGSRTVANQKRLKVIAKLCGKESINDVSCDEMYDNVINRKKHTGDSKSIIYGFAQHDKEIENGVGNLYATTRQLDTEQRDHLFEFITVPKNERKFKNMVSEHTHIDDVLFGTKGDELDRLEVLYGEPPRGEAMKPKALINMFKIEELHEQWKNEKDPVKKDKLKKEIQEKIREKMVIKKEKGKPVIGVKIKNPTPPPEESVSSLFTLGVRAKGITAAPAMEMGQTVFGGLAFKNGSVEIETWPPGDRKKYIDGEAANVLDDIEAEDVDFSNESEVRERIDYLERLKSKLGNDIKFTEKSKVEKAIAALKRGLDN